MMWTCLSCGWIVTGRMRCPNCGSRKEASENAAYVYAPPREIQADHNRRKLNLNQYERRLKKAQSELEDSNDV